MPAATKNILDREFLSTKHIRQLIPVSATTLSRMVAAGTFPAPVNFVGLAHRRWRTVDVRAYLDRMNQRQAS